MERPLRLTSVMGVARALLSTIDISDSVEILIAEFGWDATFQALSLLPGQDAEEAFAQCWGWLLTEPLQRSLRRDPWTSLDH